MYLLNLYSSIQRKTDLKLQVGISTYLTFTQVYRRKQTLLQVGICTYSTFTQVYRGKQTLNSKQKYLPTQPLLKYTGGKQTLNSRQEYVPTLPLLKYTEETYLTPGRNMYLLHLYSSIQRKTDLKLQVGICTYSTFTQVYRRNIPYSRQEYVPTQPLLKYTGKNRIMV